jgi:hypothetical protein
MTNASVATATAKSDVRDVRYVSLTYKGGQQNILIPPTAPIVAFVRGAACVNRQRGCTSRRNPPPFRNMNMTDGFVKTGYLYIIDNDRQNVLMHRFEGARLCCRSLVTRPIFRDVMFRNEHQAEFTVDFINFVQFRKKVFPPQHCLKILVEEDVDASLLQFPSDFRGDLTIFAREGDCHIKGGLPAFEGGGSVTSLLPFRKEMMGGPQYFEWEILKILNHRASFAPLSKAFCVKPASKEGSIMRTDSVILGMSSTDKRQVSSPKEIGSE